MNGHVYDLLKWSVLAGGNGGGEKINNQDKTITENGTYTADEGYTGLGTVVVNVSSGGDGDIGAEKYLEAQYAEVRLPNAEAIKEKAFYNDRVITDIYMPNVKSIGSDAFMSCTNLAITSLPSGLTSIGQQAFYGCKKIALTSLPSNITTIGRSAFVQCTELALTSLPNGVITVDDQTFSGCSKLAITSLPSNLWKVGEYAFYGCVGITEITFYGKPGYAVHARAFDACTNLTTINVPWAEGEVSGAPWGATNATINYNYTGA